VIVKARFRELEPVAVEAPSAEARVLALAYLVEAAVEGGRLRSAADVARALGVSRARISQLMKRRWAQVEEQEAAIHGCARP